MSSHENPVADLVEEFDRWANTLVSPSSSSSVTSPLGQLDTERHGQGAAEGAAQENDDESLEPLSPQEGKFSLLTI